MGRNHPQFCYLLATCWLMLLGAGCATPGPIAPQYLDPSFVPASVQEITLLPFADIRIDQSQPFNIQALMFAYQLRSRLKRWGYTVSLAKDFGEIYGLSQDDIAVADPSWVKSLGPKEARWILLVAVEDIGSLTTYGRAVRVQCLGMLFDKMPGQAVWRHKAVDEFTAGGLFGLLYPQSGVISQAFGKCINGLIKEFPAKNRLWHERSTHTLEGLSGVSLAFYSRTIHPNR